MSRLTIEECRTILGTSAAGHTDEQIEQLRNSLEHLAAMMYDEVVRQEKADPEGLRWMAYAFENPDDADGSGIPDDAFPTDGPNTLDFEDETIQ
jgi:hypothetical protein